MPIRSTEQSTSIDAITNTNTNTNDTNTKRWTKCKQILLSTSWFTKLLEHCSLCLFPCLAKFLFPSHFGVFLWFSLCVQLFKQIYATVGIRWGWAVPTERNLSCNSVREILSRKNFKSIISQRLETTSRKNAAVLLDFVQMWGGGRALPKIFVTFS